MRAVTSFQDVQIVLNKLLNWQNQLQSKDWDFHQLRIKNAAPAVDQNDYVILSQLSSPTQSSSSPLTTATICFSSPGMVSVGKAIAAPYIIGRNRAGSNPWEIHLAAQNPPIGGPLTVNMQLNGQNLLKTDLSLPAGSTANVPVVASNFVIPVPTLPLYGALTISVVTANAAALVMISLVVKLNPKMVGN